MFAKRKILSKRKAASPPPMDRESPSYDFAIKEIAHEKSFPIEELKKREECTWTLDFLEKNKYMAILKPFEDELYPRLVRLFYQNLQFGSLENGVEYFKFSIDGFSQRITIEDMAEITSLPARYEKERVPHLRPPFACPSDIDIFDYIKDNFTRDCRPGKGESLILSSLPEGLWLLDRILRENVFPLGHHSERRQEMLHMLYSAHIGHFYSLPYLFMRGIIKMTEELRNRTPAGKTRPLPYGFLITSILRFTDYPFDRREPESEVETAFPLSAWTSSYGRLLLAGRKRTSERGGPSRESTEIPSPPPTTARPTPARSPPRPSASTSTADSDILERLTRVEENQATLQEEHERILRGQRRIRRDHRRTDSVIRALARHSLGDDYQARIDAYEAEEEAREAQRGRAAEAATAAAAAAEGSDYEPESEAESD